MRRHHPKADIKNPGEQIIEMSQLISNIHHHNSRNVGPFQTKFPNWLTISLKSNLQFA